MRILDKNTDFYDYLQSVYYDTSVTFDRTDSFVLTKEIMCECLNAKHRFGQGNAIDNYHFVLLQVCHTFWMFLIHITSRTDCGTPTSYTVEFLATWKNYQSERKLVDLNIIEGFFFSYIYNNRHCEFDIEKTRKKVSNIIHLIGTNDYRVLCNISKHTIYYGTNTYAEKHIPLLKASGLAAYIDPLEIYTSFEEYFSLEKQLTERTESIGLTDKEKLENHGFDAKCSFRGKQ